MIDLQFQSIDCLVTMIPSLSLSNQLTMQSNVNIFFLWISRRLHRIVDAFTFQFTLRTTKHQVLCSEIVTYLDPSIQNSCMKTIINLAPWVEKVEFRNMISHFHLLLPMWLRLNYMFWWGACPYRPCIRLAHFLEVTAFLGQISLVYQPLSERPLSNMGAWGYIALWVPSLMHDWLVEDKLIQMRDDHLDQGWSLWVTKHKKYLDHYCTW